MGRRLSQRVEDLLHDGARRDDFATAHGQARPASNAIVLITWFMSAIHIEGVHPLESGVFRLKYRKDRRPGLPIEPIWSFYPKYWAESIHKVTKLMSLYGKLRFMYKRLKKGRNKLKYMDVALTPVTDHDTEDLEMFHTPSAPAFVAQEQRRDAANAAAREQAREHAAVA